MIDAMLNMPRRACSAAVGMLVQLAVAEMRLRNALGTALLRALVSGLGLLIGVLDAMAAAMLLIAIYRLRHLYDGLGPVIIGREGLGVLASITARAEETWSLVGWATSVIISSSLVQVIRAWLGEKRRERC